MATQTICEVEGCGKKRLARGRCDTHYAQWRRANPDKVKLPGRTPCSVDDCTGPITQGGLCGKHAYRLKVNGSPHVARRRAKEGAPLAFVDSAVSSSTDSCIEWPFSKNLGGYARVVMQGKQTNVSRVVLMLSGRPRPSNFHFAAHAPEVCHNPGCINPRHLRWATQKENEADKLIDQTLARGETGGNSKLNDTQAIYAYQSCKSEASRIAKDFGVTRKAIRNIQEGKTWRHVTLV